MSHTPGPWKVYIEQPPYAPDYTLWPLIMAGGQAGRIVANVNPESCPDISSAPASVKMPAMANAHLIAAAPELLEALKNLLCEPMAERTVDAAKRAIANATGHNTWSTHNEGKED